MESHKPTCYICYGEEEKDNPLMTESPCLCSGSLKIHWSCYRQAYEMSKRNPNREKRGYCLSCNELYNVRPYDDSYFRDVNVRQVYNKYGKLIEEFSYLYHGQGIIMHGQYREYNPSNSRIIINGQYENNKRAGLWTEISCDEGRHELTEKGNYEDDEREGIWTREIYTGTIKKDIGSYKKGIKHGHWNEWCPKRGYDGGYVYYTRYVGTYVDGMKQGEFKIYTGDVTPYAKGHFKDDQMTGEWKYYHHNGSLESEGTYENGQKQGVWTTYKKYDGKALPHGHKLYEGSYLNDKEHGTWTYYDYSTGKLEKKVTFDNGVEVKPVSVLGKRTRSQDSSQEESAVASKRTRT